MSDSVENDFYEKHMSFQKLSRINLSLRDILQELQKIEQKAPADMDLSRLTSFSTAEQNRISNLQTNADLTCSNKKLNFSFLREAALQKISNDIETKLTIMQNNIVIENKEYENVQIANRLYSWSYKDFLIRCLKDQVYLDILKTQIPLDGLTLKKHKIDIDELWRFMQMILNALNDEQKKEGLKNVLTEILDAYKFLDLYEKLPMELQDHNITIYRCANNLLSMQFVRRNTRQLNRLNELEKIFGQSSLWDPIEKRYKMKVLQNRALSTELKFNRLIERSKNEINFYKTMISTENTVSQSTLNMLYIEEERLKTRIEEMNFMYDTDYDKLEAKVAYKKSNMEKMKEMTAYYKEQIQCFHEDLKVVYAKMAAEKEAAEKARLEEEERLQQLLLAKKKKKRKSKGRMSNARTSKEIARKSKT